MKQGLINGTYHIQLSKEEMQLINEIIKDRIIGIQESSRYDIDPHIEKLIDKLINKLENLVPKFTP